MHETLVMICLFVFFIVLSWGYLKILGLEYSIKINRVKEELGILYDKLSRGNYNKQSILQKLLELEEYLDEF